MTKKPPLRRAGCGHMIRAWSHRERCKECAKGYDPLATVRADPFRARRG